MATAIRIRNWRQHFEVSQSLRIVGPLTWVGLPTKHDGKSYRRMIRLPNGPALFGCWCLIVQTAAKCPIRGVLADSDGPLTSEDMEAKTGCPASLFDETIQLLLSKQINWLEEVDFSSISEHPPPYSENTPSTGQTEPTGPDRPYKEPPPVSGGGILNGKENGTDGSQIRLRALDKIKPVHIANPAALEALQTALGKSAPGHLEEGEAGLLQLMGAAERAIQIGKSPIRLFVSIVRDSRWELIDDSQKKSAKERLDLYRKKQAESKCTQPNSI